MENQLSKLAHYSMCDLNAGAIFDLRYWRLSPSKAELASWDGAVHQASEEYSHRMVCLIFIIPNSDSQMACDQMAMLFKEPYT